MRAGTGNSSRDIEAQINAGKSIIVPMEEQTIEDWTGAGYIILNRDTYAGEYIISGGLNGGSVSVEVTVAMLVNVVMAAIDLGETVNMVQLASLAFLTGGLIGDGIGDKLIKNADNPGKLLKSIKAMEKNGTSQAFIKTVVTTMPEESIIRIGKLTKQNVPQEFIEKLVNNPKALNNVSDFTILIFKESAKSYDDIVTLMERHGDELQSLYLLHKDSMVDVVLKYGDDAIAGINRHGEDFVYYYFCYGDEFVECYFKNDDVVIEVITKYGDDAATGLKNHGDVFAELYDTYRDEFAEDYLKYQDEAVEAYKKYGDEASEVLNGNGTGESNTRIYRDATQKDIALINNIKTKYNAGKTRNAASAKGIIDGESIELECISGQFTHDNYYNKGNFEPPQPENYHYEGPIPEYTNHTEQKIVEYLRERFKDNPNVSGEIEIVSERVFCDNCKVLVDMFENEFPNIKVIRVEIVK